MESKYIQNKLLNGKLLGYNDEYPPKDPPIELDDNPDKNPIKQHIQISYDPKNENKHTLYDKFRMTVKSYYINDPYFFIGKYKNSKIVHAPESNANGNRYILYINKDGKTPTFEFNTNLYSKRVPYDYMKDHYPEYFNILTASDVINDPNYNMNLESPLPDQPVLSSQNENPEKNGGKAKRPKAKRPKAKRPKAKRTQSKRSKSKLQKTTRSRKTKHIRKSRKH